MALLIILASTAKSTSFPPPLFSQPITFIAPLLLTPWVDIPPLLSLAGDSTGKIGAVELGNTWYVASLTVLELVDANAEIGVTTVNNRADVTTATVTFLITVNFLILETIEISK